MKKKICLFLALLVADYHSAQVSLQHPALSDIVNGNFRQKTKGGDLRSTPDGNHYTAMDQGRKRIIKYDYKTGNEVETLFDVSKARECHFKDFNGYEIAPTGHYILLWREKEMIYRRSFRATTYVYDVRRNMVQPLSEVGGKVMIPTFSPDGRMCSFVRDNNIWIKKLDYDTEVQVTKDGELNRVINGASDWVYEEEFAVTNLTSWSDDSNFLAFVRFDESEVKQYHMQTYGNGTYPDFYTYKYPKAGENNSTVSVLVYNVETKDTKTLETPGNAAYVPRITFVSTTGQLAVTTLNRQQNIFHLYYANPKSNVFKLILKEENQRYIDSEWISQIHFSKNGFLYVSEKDGYAHIYQYTHTGVEVRQVTTGNWDVTDLVGYDENTNTVYYESGEESPLRRSVYKVDAKGVKTRLTTQEGINSAKFSDNFAYYVNHYSNTRTPLVISVYDAKTNKPLRVIQDNSALRSKLNNYTFSAKEFIKIETDSGHELNGWIVKPPDFDESKKYPVVMFQYSGPNSQSVLDRFAYDWEQFLVIKGFVCVCFDGRGTGARGEAFRKCTYLRMGELESQDQAAAAREIAKWDFVDANRIGIWGWSFGGYNTLMAMSTGDGIFKAGIAVAPPTDWKHYDTVYTERFMRTPQENEDGYKATSPIKLADKLQGKLLLIHGTADDNVHFKQSMDYAEALVQAGKQFDMHIYKDRNHRITGGNTQLHLYTKMTDFFVNNL